MVAWHYFSVYIVAEAKFIPQDGHACEMKKTGQNDHVLPWLETYLFENLLLA